MSFSKVISLQNQKSQEERWVPIIASIFYVLLICLLFFLVKLQKPLDLDEGAGLLVDFGYTDKGLGDEEPSVDNPLTEVAIPSPGNPPFTQTVTEQVIVQEEEETEKVETPNTDVVQKVVVVENVLKNNKKADNINPDSKETSKKLQEEKKVNENAIFKGFKGMGTGDGSQGNTAGQGNMGDLSGSKSDNYLGKSTGLGSEGEGRGMIGRGLLGRKLSYIPEINDKSNKTGKIVVKVTVNSDGKVVKSEYTAQGSTLTDADLIAKCEAAGRKAKFTPMPDRDSDIGTLIFSFDIR